MGQNDRHYIQLNTVTRRECMVHWRFALRNCSCFMCRHSCILSEQAVSYYQSNKYFASNFETCFFLFFSPPENDSFRKDFCFSPDVFFLFLLQSEISEMRGPTGVKFCTMVSNRPNFIMPVQNFGTRTPKKFQGPKTCKIRLDFGRLRSSASNVSETDEDIQNR